jgi:DNA-binding protein HU-beta
MRKPKRAAAARAAERTVKKRTVAKTKAKAKAKTTARKSAASKAGKPDTVTLRHMANDLADAHGLSKKQANDMLLDMVDMIGKHLKKGARIRIGGLGILQVRKRPARMGRNPATGEAIKIKASKKVAFRVAKELKQSI